MTQDSRGITLIEAALILSILVVLGLLAVSFLTQNEETAAATSVSSESK